MKAANRFGSGLKAVVLGVIVATFLLAPLGVVPVNADGGSPGQPGDPPTDSTLKAPAVYDPTPTDDLLITTIDYVTLLRYTGI